MFPQNELPKNFSLWDFFLCTISRQLHQLNIFFI